MRWIALPLAISFVCATVSEGLADKRVALVIGNKTYKAASLSNPGRDVELLRARLQSIGFKVVGDVPLVDLDKVSTDKWVQEFATQARNADVALFYFSGHGVQVEGENYLLPTDVEELSPASIDFQTLPAAKVLAAMERANASLKIMLLDACRTNPFLRQRGSRGLAVMEVPEGTVIGFATAPNKTATDGGPGTNSPYAKALEYYMQVRGLGLLPLLNNVGLRVKDETYDRQRPWLSASPISGDPILYQGPPPPVISIAKPEHTPELPSRVPPDPVSLPRAATTGLIKLAYKQLDRDDYSAARATLSRAIDVDSNVATAFSYRGFAWYLEGREKKAPKEALTRYQSALADFDRAIELDPIDAPVRRHRGNTRMAEYWALQALGQSTNGVVEKTVKDFEEAVRLDPASKRNANALGRAYLLHGSYDLAIENFKKAINRDEKYASAYSGLCFAYRKRGDMDTARRNARLAATHDPELAANPCLTQSLSGFLSH